MSSSSPDRVPFLDLKSAYAEQGAELDEALLSVGRGAWYLLGERLDAFEKAYAKYVGARHCVGLANGLDALHLALRALGVGAGDEVIVPSHTFIASWLAVSHVGATPVPVEVDEGTYCMDPTRVEAAITPKTRVLMPVHLYGHPADMSSLRGIAEQRGLKLLEDAAQAQGAAWRGCRVGALGDAAAWSFYPGKNLGALGDAGAVTTDDDRVADALRKLRNYGAVEKYRHEVDGVNSRLDDIQAAALLIKLGRLDEWNDRRRQVAGRYAEGLRGLPLRLPSVTEGADAVWHLYVVRTPRRDALREHLHALGVETVIHYPTPCHRQNAYASLGIAEGKLPVAESIAREVLSLPMGPHLTEAQQERVIAAVKSFAF